MFSYFRNYKILIFLLFISSLASYSEDSKKEINPNDLKVAKIYKIYTEGDYGAALKELELFSEEAKLKNDVSKKTNGLIAYWRGLIYYKLFEYPDAIKNFKEAVELKFDAQDLYYQYAQCLYAQEKLAAARSNFQKSIKKNFKIGVSYYYIAYISQKLKEYKTAVSYYNQIERLSDEEKKDVLQPARMQVGDIYLEQVEKLPDSFRQVDKYVIPQYKKALAVDEKSPLANQLREKILELERRYELVLFQMRNGRPTLRPPYFLRIAQDFTRDSNVNAVAEPESTDASLKSITSLLGRYTFYLGNAVSTAPEIRYANTKHLTSEEAIYGSDNYNYNLALRNSFEHNLFEKQASFLIDYDSSRTYIDNKDGEADKTLEFSSQSNIFMIGERFNFGGFGESVIRFRSTTNISESGASDQSITSFTWEQVKSVTQSILMIFMGTWDTSKGINDAEDVDALKYTTQILRFDFILPKLFDTFTPTTGVSYSRKTYTQLIDERGTETTMTPSLRLTKNITRTFRFNIKMDSTTHTSKSDDYSYKKSTYGIDFEYVF